jgi:hypothetical protein
VGEVTVNGLVFANEGVREDAQDEVDVVAEEGTHDERECTPGKGEQKHVHGRHFVLGRKGRVREMFSAMRC